MGIEVIVELVVAINQLLQFCGELLSDYRFIQQLLWGRLGFILLTTAPDHCKCSMVWSVISYVLVSNKVTLIGLPNAGESTRKGYIYNMKKVKKNEGKLCKGGKEFLFEDSHINRAPQPKAQP